MSHDSISPSASGEHPTARALGTMRPTFVALGDCESDCQVVVGRPVRVGSFTFQVRPTVGEPKVYEVWRCGADLGSFVLGGDGTIQVVPRSAFSVDEVLLSLVAEAYRASSSR